MMNGKPTDLASLDNLISDPGLIQDLSGAVVQRMLIQLTSLRPLLVAKSHSAPISEKVQEDRLLTVAEAAAKLGMTKDYLYRHAETFPFSVRVSPKQLRFSLNGIERYIRQRRV